MVSVKSDHPAEAATLAARLEPAQRALAGLERKYLLLARTGNEPGDWATWSDLNAALMVIRGVQGRDALEGATP